jgi:hypothetical protein
MVVAGSYRLENLSFLLFLFAVILHESTFKLFYTGSLFCLIALFFHNLPHIFGQSVEWDVSLQ